MAEGYEGFHVPQQSRRDKLRIVTTQNHPSCLEPTINLHRFAGLLPLYDPSSLISSDLLTCASATGQDFHNHYQHQTGLLPGPAEGCRENEGCSIKEESVNLMGFAGNLMNTPPSSSSSRLHQTQHPYFELQSSLSMNPTPIQDINSNPLFNFSHTVQNPRDFDHVYSSGGDLVVFKPEPLSLSLSSHPTYQNSHQLELNLQRYGSGLYPSPIVGSMSNNISRSSVPLGPFTGYASILKGSRFLRPAQQLLVELCEIWCQGNNNEKLEDDSALMDSTSDIFDDSFSSDGDGDEGRRKKSRLISMLDEVYRRYKQYYQQMQEVVLSFECVSGKGKAAPCVNFAIISMSKHFRCLKNAISDQLQISNKATSNYCWKYGPDSGFLDQQPVWRPQRVLPERAVTVLRAWLFEHFLHPYPTDSDKVMLAKQTGLSRGQVSNWFINARVRLWKPMVEEIHVLETRLGQKQQQREGRTEAGNRTSDHLPSKNSLESNDSSKSTQLVQDIPTKRARTELQKLAMGNERQLNPSYNNLDPQMDANMSIARGNGGVSLTLGLHQNNVIDLLEPFPVNAVQRYGLGIEDKMNGDVYVMGGSKSELCERAAFA